MSPGLISDKFPIKGIPSNTTNGSLEAVSERVPRIRICMVAPGCEDVCVMSTPATRFCKAYVIFVEGISCNLSPPTDAIDPVTSDFLAVP